MSVLSIDNSFSKIYIAPHAEVLDDLVGNRRVIVITDGNIDRLYSSELSRFERIVIGRGEANKNLATVNSIYEQLMTMGADRSTLLLGIGGGIVTDITGFVAATYMRGLKFGFISTTLLGQVDAAVGGKNGVNVADYKNMVGTFAHPEFVILDIAMLKTLPLRELRAGMSEVVKAAIIGDSYLFELIEREGTSKDMYANEEFMQTIVSRAIRLKLSIVEQDEREGGMRRLLNLGHTLGHAIEKCTHDVNHGEAVAIGMMMISEAAVRRGELSATECQRIIGLLSVLGFKRDIGVQTGNIIREVKHDKKKSGNDLNVVMPCGIGKCRIERLSYDEFEQMFTTKG